MKYEYSRLHDLYFSGQKKPFLAFYLNHAKMEQLVQMITLGVINVLAQLDTLVQIANMVCDRK